MLVSGPALGLALGWLRGGDPRRLADLRIRWWPVLAAGIFVRLMAGLAGELAAPLYVIGFAAIIGVAGANRSLPGLPLIAAGGALNLIVVAANGGMPVDLTAVAAAGARMPADRLHIELTERSALSLLADILPVPLVRSVYSVGDVLLAAGGFWLPFVWMRRR